VQGASRWWRPAQWPAASPSHDRDGVRIDPDRDRGDRDVGCGVDRGDRAEQQAWPSSAKAQTRGPTIRKLKSILLIVDRQPAPALLPILRSQQQGEILALLLGDPDLELSLTEIAARIGAPHPSVHREIQRAERC
jgi:hypothetical protein